MKKILLFVLLFHVGLSYSQSNINIDQRLIKNHGDNIYQIFERQKSYYDFLLWELDNGYVVVDNTSIEKEVLLSAANIVNSSGEHFNISIIDNPILFNFIDYNFERNKDYDVFYDLGNGKSIKFTSLTAIWDDFRASN